MIPPLLFVCRTVSDAKNTEGQWRSVFLSWLVIYTYFSSVDATLSCALYQWSVIALEVIRVRRLILATLREISLAMPYIELAEFEQKTRTKSAICVASFIAPMCTPCSSAVVILFLSPPNSSIVK